MNHNLKTILFVLVLLGVGYLLLPYVKNNDRAATNEEQKSSANAGQGLKIYSSDRLGMEFNYLADQDKNGENDTTVTEKNNIIYVHGTKDQPQAGQWIEMFEKKSDETLKTAVEEKFLANIPREQCFVESTDIPKDESGSFQSNLVVGEIAYPLDKPKDPVGYEHNCSPEYSRTNGLRYFLMSQARPDKFYFFEIGQYAILGSNDGQDVPWQSTIKLK